MKLITITFSFILITSCFECISNKTEFFLKRSLKKVTNKNNTGIEEINQNDEDSYDPESDISPIINDSFSSSSKAICYAIMDGWLFDMNTYSFHDDR